MSGEWRNVTKSNDPKFLVKGTELNTKVCGRLSRYQLCEIRSYEDNGFPDRIYYVRDAHTISDADIRDGVRPKIVATFKTQNEAMNFIENNS
jgi:hypothetical protein